MPLPILPIYVGDDSYTYENTTRVSTVTTYKKILLCISLIAIANWICQIAVQVILPNITDMTEVIAKHKNYNVLKSTESLLESDYDHNSTLGLRSPVIGISSHDYHSDDGISRRKLEEEGEEEDPPVMDNTLRVDAIIGLFGVITIMSIGFEEFQNYLTHYFKHTGQHQYLRMIDASFKELTILGFVGLSLMCLVKSGTLKTIAIMTFPRIREHEERHQAHIRKHGHAHYFKHGFHHHGIHTSHPGYQEAQEAAESERRLQLSESDSAPRRTLHEEFDPLTAELYHLFEEVHMMLFFVMVAFICLVGVLLIQAKITKMKFHICEHAKLEDFLKGKINHNVGKSPSDNSSSESMPLLQRILAGPGIEKTAIHYRLMRREFFHPYDKTLKNNDIKPASFNFGEYLAKTMSEFVVELIEIPSSSFIAVFVILCACQPVFLLGHMARERFMVIFAWIIALSLMLTLYITKKIYIKLLPEHAQDFRELEKVEAQNISRLSHIPAYQQDRLVVGGPLSEWFKGTTAPNKHEALFPLWKNGPKLFNFTLQLALFLQGIYVAVYLVHILPYERSWLDVMAQFVPLTLSLFYLWPEVLFYYTIAANTGMMKKPEFIAEVIQHIEEKQFKKYSKLIFELQVKSYCYWIEQKDNYIKTGKPVRNGEYEVWLRQKIYEFENTYPQHSQEAINEAFDMWDEDRSDMIEEEEMRNMLKSQGRHASSIDTVIRRWFYSGVFRPVHNKDGNLIPKPPAGGMSRDDFKVFVQLSGELDEGEFDEERLKTWFKTRLDASGDGMVSVDEFKTALPQVCAASGLANEDIQKMFKIVEASNDESFEAQEIEIEKLIIWLKKFAQNRRKHRGSSMDMPSSGAGMSHVVNPGHRQGSSSASKPAIKPMGSGDL